jgi:hypothetical protein
MLCPYGLHNLRYYSSVRIELSYRGCASRPECYESLAFSNNYVKVSVDDITSRLEQCLELAAY